MKQKHFNHIFKILLFIMLLLTFVFSMCGCSLQSHLSYLKSNLSHLNQYNKVKYIDTYNGINRVKYNGIVYHEVSPNCFSVNPDNLERISWHINLPFSSFMEIYANPVSSPDYLWFLSRSVYVSENFDYQNEFFVLDNTALEIPYSDILSNRISNPEPALNNHGKVFSCTMRSQKHPELYMDLNIIKFNKEYYISTCTGSLYKMTDSFYVLLSNAGLIH